MKRRTPSTGPVYGGRRALRRIRYVLAASAAGLLIAACTSQAPEGAADADGPGSHAVATAHPAATDAATAILAQGGNAFDAAVAATATLGVVEPFGSGIGGGGFWLLHDATTGESVMLDGRETAPGEAHRDLYRDDDGEIMEAASLDGPLAAAIPGTPAALVHLAREYGALPLSESLQPAIDAARDGFEVGERYRILMGFRQTVVADSPAAAEIFLDDGEIPEKGTRIVQDDLADTLEGIADDDAESFYRGELAERMVTAVRDAGGVWHTDDLPSTRCVSAPP